jgi:toxin ParE1/3/4
MKISLHPGAEKDIDEAARFYEREGSPVLAARFVTEFKRLGALLAEHPGIGSPRTKGRRGFAMSIFPFTVIYRADVSEIHILVIKHDSKHPGYGARRA